MISYNCINDHNVFKKQTLQLNTGLAVVYLTTAKIRYPLYPDLYFSPKV